MFARGSYREKKAKLSSDLHSWLAYDVEDGRIQANRDDPRLPRPWKMLSGHMHPLRRGWEKEQMIRLTPRVV